MYVQSHLHILYDKFAEHWISALFLFFTLLTILSISILRWILRRRWQQVLQQKFEEEEHELDTLPPMTAQDQRALDLIRQFRQEVWDIPEVELQLSIEALTQRAMRIVREISSVYYPDTEVPQYEASLSEILQMIRRVSGRLYKLAGIVPFKFLGTRKLSDYQRYYQVYRKINENPVLQLFKRNPHIYKVARWAMNIKNLSNPLYWAGRELSREGYFYVLRWFYITFVSQIGREAMKLYSGRHFQADEDRDATLVFYRLFELTRRWGGPSSAEWPLLLDYITGHSGLEPDVKLHILSRWSEDRMPKDLQEQQFQTRAGVKWYREGLKRLLDKDPNALPFKIQVIEQELSSAKDIEAPSAQ